jgi:hypothetical protein
LPSDFDEYGPYHTPLFTNSVDFAFRNTGGTGEFNFRVLFSRHPDHSSPVYSADTLSQPEQFSVGNGSFPSGGLTVSGLDSATVIFSPSSSANLVCGEIYFVKIETTRDYGSTWEVLSDNKSFVSACSPSFVDVIDFDFTNSTTSDNDFHFRVRYFIDGERTNLYRTEFSGNNASGWSADGEPFAEEGVPVIRGETKAIRYAPDPSNFDPSITYNLVIDAYDGSSFSLASNSYTFRTIDTNNLAYCGPYMDVPVVEKFGVMFEMAGKKRTALNE